MAPFSAKTMENSIKDILIENMPTYLELYCPGVEHPRSIQRRNAVDRWAEDQMPSIVVASVGITDVPERTTGGDDGRPMYLTNWGIGIGAIVMAADQESTRDVAEDYAAVIRTLILHNKSLGGIAQDTFWVREDYDEFFVPDMERTLLAAVVLFQARIYIPIEPKPAENIRLANSVSVDVRPKED